METLDEFSEFGIFDSNSSKVSMHLMAARADQAFLGLEFLEARLLALHSVLRRWPRCLRAVLLFAEVVPSISARL